MGIMSEIDLDRHEGCMSATTDFYHSGISSSDSPQLGVTEPIVQLGIDRCNYTSKPDENDVRGIKTKMPQNTVTVPLSAVINAVKHGQTFCPAVVEGDATIKIIGSHRKSFV